jgi:L-methionine (R)-S-oxide reductase
MAPTADLSILLQDVEARLKQTEKAEADFQAVLDQILNSFECTAGTIHGLDPQSQTLHLRARRNIPDGLLPRIRQIPVGKGLAGLAAERRQPVQVCNLQSDSSGLAKPGAKETGMEGCIAVPMMIADQIVGVLGVAKATTYEFSPTEVALLVQIGGVIGRFLPLKP